MLYQFLIFVIFYIVINQLILSFSNDTDKSIMNNNITENQPKIPLDLFGKPSHVEPNNFIAWTFRQPKPWTQITYKYGDKQPFGFSIKIKIPSLNDLLDWQKLIPNLNFHSKTGELVIRADDEPSALAIANLIVSTFNGKLSINNIIKNNLLKTSITKAQKHKLVANKLREQINDMLYGEKPEAEIEDKFDYEEDLVKTTKAQEMSQPEAFEGGEFSYL